MPLRRFHQEYAASHSYHTALATLVSPGENRLRHRREEHPDEWEPKRSPQLLISMYHRELTGYSPSLADELLQASQGKLELKHTSWPNPDRDADHQQPWQTRSSTIWLAADKSFLHTTQGDRETAGIILSYALTQPLQNAVEHVQTPAGKEQFTERINSLQWKLKASFSNREYHLYQEATEDLQNLSQEIQFIDSVNHPEKP